MSSDFKSTCGVTTEVAVLKGDLFRGSNRFTSEILNEAERRKLSKPNAELACLIREKFTDNQIKELGLILIVVMHDPISDLDNDLARLTVPQRSLGLSYTDRWGHETGFAFAVSKSAARV